MNRQTLRLFPERSHLVERGDVLEDGAALGLEIVSHRAAKRGIGEDALYGRYWGTVTEVPHLHFEICYYQAIEAAIARGLARVEAGAQGAHKLARGYRPVPTYSAHFIPNASFRAAVAQFLEREREAVADEMEALDAMTPFRKGGDAA